MGNSRVVNACPYLPNYIESLNFGDVLRNGLRGTSIMAYAFHLQTKTRTAKNTSDKYGCAQGIYCGGWD